MDKKIHHINYDTTYYTVNIFFSKNNYVKTEFKNHSYKYILEQYSNLKELLKGLPCEIHLLKVAPAGINIMYKKYLGTPSVNILSTMNSFNNAHKRIIELLDKYSQRMSECDKKLSDMYHTIENINIEKMTPERALDYMTEEHKILKERRNVKETYQSLNNINNKIISVKNIMLDGNNPSSVKRYI